MKKELIFAVLVMGCAVAVGFGQTIDSEPVFRVQLVPDRSPLVAGEELYLAVVIQVEHGWHINSDEPGDEFSIPTKVEFELPDGWPSPVLSFPNGLQVEFEFSDSPIEVWEGRVVVPGHLVVPQTVIGEFRLRAAVTAQACNNTQCLPPEKVRSGVDVTVAPAGSSSKAANEELFAQIVEGDGASDLADDSSGLTSKSLPLLLIGVFFAGLALNLTPCVFPLIPITIGFFSQQTKDREGSTFPLALAYVLGIAATYSILGVLAALSGAIFGGALQSPWVVGLIVVVLLSLATSMFGLWELRVPGWAQRA
jgi:thiol:disulfide interchange protein DsbD